MQKISGSRVLFVNNPHVRLVKSLITELFIGIVLSEFISKLLSVDCLTQILFILPA